MSKKKKPANKKSKAWADFERQIAEEYRKAGFKKAKRILRSGDFGESRPDVEVPEIPQMMLDMKYRVGGWSHHSVFKEQIEDRYVKPTPENFGVMHSKSGNERGSFVTIKLEVWLAILKRAFLGDKKSSSDWHCPRCGSEVAKAGDQLLHLSVYKCTACGLSFASEDNSA